MPRMVRIRKRDDKPSQGQQPPAQEQPTAKRRDTKKDSKPTKNPSMSKQAQGDKKLKSPEIAAVSSVSANAKAPAKPTAKPTTKAAGKGKIPPTQAHGANKGKKAGDSKRGDIKESEGRGSRGTTPEKAITKGNGAPCQMVAPGKNSHGGNKHPGSSQKVGKTIDRNNIVSDKDGKVKNSSPLRCVEGDSARDSPSRTSTAKGVVGLVSSAPAPERHKTFSPWKSRVGDSVLTDITTGNNAQVCGQVIANPQVCGGQVFGEKITTVALVSASYSGQESLGRSHVGRAPDVQSAVAAGIRNGPLADPLGEGTGILSGEYRLSDCSEGVLSGDYRSITDSGFISRSYGSTSSTTTAVVSSLSRACAKTVANTMPGENHAPKSSGTSSSASDAGKTATTSESEQSQSSNGSKPPATVNRTEPTQKEPDQSQPGPDSAAPEGEIAGNGTASLSESTISEPSISISDRQNPTSTQAPVTMGVETTVVAGTGVSPQGSTLSLPVATSSCPTGASNGSVASSDITVSTAMASTSDTSSSVGSTSTAPPGAAVGNNKSKTKLEWRRRMHSSPIERSVENPPPSPRFAFSFDVPQPKTSGQAEKQGQTRADLLSSVSEDFLICQICFEEYSKPKLLPCLHFFCERCLVRYVADRSHKFECPTCGQETCLTERGVARLKDNFFISNLCDTLSMQRGRVKEKKVSCAICSDEDAEATSRCLECADFLCPDCATSHCRTRFTRGHHVVTLEDLQSGRFEEQLRSKQEVYCDMHQGEVVRFYCESCDNPVCRDCVVVEHKDHKHADIKDVVGKSRLLLEGLLKSTRQKIPEFEFALAEVHQVQEMKKSERDRVEIDIKQRAKELIALIQQQEQSLLSELHFMYSREQKDLATEESFLEKSLNSLKSSVNFTEKVLKYGNNEEVLSVKKEMADRLYRLSQREPERKMSDRLSSNHLVFISTPGDTRSILMKVGYIKNQVPTSAIPYYKYCLKPGPGQSKSARLLHQFGRRGSGDGEFNGPYRVAVTAEGHVVVGDRNNRRIQIFDTEGRMKSKFPAGSYSKVAVMHDGNLAVTDSEGNIRLCAQDGSVIHEFKPPVTSCYSGIAVDKLGRIIVTDAINHSVCIFEPDGTQIHQFGTKGSADDEFKAPSYVTVNSKSHIIVSDTRNHCIKIFDQDGKFLNKLGSLGTGDGHFDYPAGVCVDSKDNIIVSDYGNKRVELFQNDLKFLRHIASVEDGLLHPEAVAVTPDGFLVLTDTGTNDIKIFMY
ncbi:tripartite motif-containing protein 2-like isoform X2 [Branchiostoma floridae]|uniref:RING-type E3 ubiquitin transferase n=1 Tax=Branchiostoma floridae TaxID=7739 RepID=A0A9J7MLL8_BRAFL|nr:tripartite motif-containing protein 2-like isoform X2 [Branchiostoma floridae]